MILVEDVVSQHVYYLSNNNTLTGNTANSNHNYGIVLSSSSNNNTLTENTASNNDYGIWLGSSSDNLIYNNYFNNTKNACDDGNNQWNITKTSGTNIIGGPYLGGNYWSDYAGNDTDWDGLGDTLTPYNSSGDIANGGDYHPLVVPTDGGHAIGNGRFCPDGDSTLPGGKARFGFTARYKGGISTGKLSCQYKDADIKLKSTSIDWLTIGAVSALFQGTGTINGGGLYTFQVKVEDNGEPGGMSITSTSRSGTAPIPGLIRSTRQRTRSQAGISRFTRNRGDVSSDSGAPFRQRGTALFFDV